MEHTFVWADLSTFDVEHAKRFYADCFDACWHDPGGGYGAASLEGREAFGLYEMPEEFQKIGMPSFWMSYVRVGDLDRVVAVAEQHGGKIEVRSADAPGGGRVALIRDPAGAGFTCYQGDAFGAGDAPGATLHELHVSDLAKVEPFYTAVFGWVIGSADETARCTIRTASGVAVGGIQVTPNELKGDKEYWGVYFPVADLGDARRRVERAGGKVVADQPIAGRAAFLAYDPQGAAFYVTGGASTGGPERTHRWKVRAMLGLVGVAAAVLLDLSWVWGVIFLMWVVPDLASGTTHFFEPVSRRLNPVVYWLIVAAWVALAVYFLFPWGGA